MNRRPSARMAYRLVAGLLLVAGPASIVAACGGDDNDDVTDAINASDDQTADTLPSGDSVLDLSDITLPEDLPDNLPLSEDCLKLAQTYSAALAAAGSGQSFEGLEERARLAVQLGAGRSEGRRFRTRRRLWSDGPGDRGLRWRHRRGDG